MARQEVHSDDTKIEQMPPIVDAANYEGDIVLTEKIGNADHLSELMFNEEPVTIRLEPSTDKNALNVFEVWVNGKGAEVFHNGRWHEITYLPVGQEIVIKRKVLAVIASAKTDTIHTEVLERDSERPNNRVQRFTSAIHSFSVIEDQNPRGHAWLREIRRRYF